MGTTGFIRTATRWLSCSGIVFAGVAGACASSSSARVYEPPQTAARLSLDDIHDRLTEMMVFECPRLLGSRDRRRGSVSIDLAVGTDGRVQHATIHHGSGDATFDDIAGGLAARLALAPPQQVMANDPPTHRLTVLYECAPAGADIRLDTDSL